MQVQVLVLWKIAVSGKRWLGAEGESRALDCQSCTAVASSPTGSFFSGLLFSFVNNKNNKQQTTNNKQQSTTIINQQPPP
jgi:hypothetical protein